jgi:hypothetical protein
MLRELLSLMTAIHDAEAVTEAPFGALPLDPTNRKLE